MSNKTPAIPLEDFEETMINATPDELKQVSAWLQECGRVDAQTCVVDDYGPPISLDKPPFPLEVKKAGSAAADLSSIKPRSWRYPSEAPNAKGLPKVSWLDFPVPTFSRRDLNAPKRLAISMGVSYHEAMMKAISWYSSKERQAFEVWCSIGLSVVTGPWEERHEID